MNPAPVSDIPFLKKLSLAYKKVRQRILTYNRFSKPAIGELVTKNKATLREKARRSWEVWSKPRVIIKTRPMRQILVFAPYLLVPLSWSLLFRKFKFTLIGWTYVLTSLFIFIYPFVLFRIADTLNPPPPGPRCGMLQLGFFLANTLSYFFPFHFLCNLFSTGSFWRRKTNCRQPGHRSLITETINYWRLLKIWDKMIERNFLSFYEETQQDFQTNIRLNLCFYARWK